MVTQDGSPRGPLSHSDTFPRRWEPDAGLPRRNEFERVVPSGPGVLKWWRFSSNPRRRSRRRN